MAKRFKKKRVPWPEWISRRALSLPGPVLEALAGGPVRRDGQRLDPALAALCRAVGWRTRFHRLEPAAARRRLKQLEAMTPKTVTPMGRVEELGVPGPGGALRVRVYTPADLPPGSPAVVYFHQGGWVLGDLDGVDPWCRMIADRTPCRVLSVDYRLAPEHPFPAAVDDALAAYRWAVEHADALEIDPRRVAVAGDSAGANLASVVASLTSGSEEARDSGTPVARPVAQMLLYPVTSARRDSESYRIFAEGFGLERPTMEWFFEHYLGGADGEDPRVSPLLAKEVSHLPPTLVATAGFDVLRDEGDAYAERLRAAGVEVVHLRFPSLIHGFAGLTGLRAPRIALDRVIAELAVIFRRAALTDRGPTPA